MRESIIEYIKYMVIYLSCQHEEASKIDLEEYREGSSDESGTHVVRKVRTGRTVSWNDDLSLCLQ